MALRQAVRPLTSARCSITASASRRAFSTKPVSEPLRFSLQLPASQSLASSDIFSKLRSWHRVSNDDGHDAAVVLATPEHARTIVDEAFMGELAEVLASSASPANFHLLGAAVDHIAPPLGSYSPMRGLSILRGRLDEILPGLWEPSRQRSREDANTQSALTINLGRPSITLPLANTTFHNERGSTLIASQFSLSGSGRKLLRRQAKFSQRVSVPVPRRISSVDNLGLWVPLVPVTEPRTVAASFGNIIKRVEVQGKAVPASTELEEAVDKIFQFLPAARETGPVGVWALVTPDGVAPLANGGAICPQPTLEGLGDVEDMAEETASYVRQMYSQGARLYKILSGGGGWGEKKGLLSLDPQRTHFALSEEESMQQFIRSMGGSSMEGSDFAPAGSHIQFFASIDAQESDDQATGTGIVLGVHGSSESTRDVEVAKTHDGLFGALSDSGLFITDSGSNETSTSEAAAAGSKLSVPHSRVFVSDDPGQDFWGELATTTAVGDVIDHPF